jgi:hypothetical protein
MLIYFQIVTVQYSYVNISPHTNWLEGNIKYKFDTTERERENTWMVHTHTHTLSLSLNIHIGYITCF